MRKLCQATFVSITALSLTACLSDSDNEPPAPPEPITKIYAGASSNSLLPTVNGAREYLDNVVGWQGKSLSEPFNPGVYVPHWDQGDIEIANGEPDAVWVHDDLKVSAIALSYEGSKVLLITTDTYSQFAADIDEIKQQAQDNLPEEWKDTPIIISATHNHQGPDTAFNINDNWYQLMVDETLDAMNRAIDNLQEAKLTVASGEHNFGVSDQSGPDIRDASLNVLAIDAADGSAIATIVQWNSHPETITGLHPDRHGYDITAACAEQGWDANDCQAEGRMFTSDYPGALRDYIMANRGGEVLYYNGAVGDQVGPHSSPVWKVTEAHPASGDGVQIPEGAEPLVEDCSAQNRDPFFCRTFATIETVGTALAKASMSLLENGTEVDVSELTVKEQPFYTRLNNMLFKFLIPAGGLGWNNNMYNRIYSCDEKPFTDDNCTLTGEVTEVDPLVSQLTGGPGTVVSGNALKTQLTHVDFGDVGMLFMPGELPGEFVIGIPDDYVTNIDKYLSKEDQTNHNITDSFTVPGVLMSLPEESITFRIGLGTDQLGYWIPRSNYRLPCNQGIMSMMGISCSDLATAEAIEDPEWVSGETCHELTDNPDKVAESGNAGEAALLVCKYGQMIGRLVDDVPGHYEETNSAGWDLVEDTWNAATQLFAQ